MIISEKLRYASLASRNQSAMVRQIINAVLLLGLWLPTSSQASTYIGSGAELSFPMVAIGTSESIDIYFDLGITGADEDLISVSGPEFTLTSGLSSPFSFENVLCSDVGIGISCEGQAKFSPDSVDDFVSSFLVSAAFTFREIHFPTDEIYEYSDWFDVTLRGSGVASVPIPGSFLLLAGGLMCFCGWRWKKNFRAFKLAT